MGNPRLWPVVMGCGSFFLSQWCWNEHRDMTVKQTLLNELSGLEEQVKVLRLDFEKRTGAELLANSCLWPWLIRHAMRFRVKTNGVTPCQHACDSTYSSELLPFGELVLFRIPLDAQIRTGQSTEVTVDGTRDSGVVDWTKTMHTSSSLKTVERFHELSADFF